MPLSQPAPALVAATQMKRIFELSHSPVQTKSGIPPCENNAGYFLSLRVTRRFKNHLMINLSIN